MGNIQKPLLVFKMRSVACTENCASAAFHKQWLKTQKQVFCSDKRSFKYTSCSIMVLWGELNAKVRKITFLPQNVKSDSKGNNKKKDFGDVHMTQNGIKKKPNNSIQYSSIHRRCLKLGPNYIWLQHDRDVTHQMVCYKRVRWEVVYGNGFEKGRKRFGRFCLVLDELSLTGWLLTVLIY